MARKHTPGPWTLKQLDCPNSYWQQYEIRSGSLLIGNLDLVTTHSNPSANASLIAAAPELLAALKNLLPLWESGIKEPWIEQARAAIAKATEQD